MQNHTLAFRIAVATCALLSPGAVVAQQESGQFGIGIGLSTYSFPDFEMVPGPTVYLPILAGDRLMIEPGLGLRYRNVSSEEGREKASAVSVGAGILYLFPTEGRDRFYLGPRVGLVRVAVSAAGPGPDVDQTTLSLFVAGVAGVEFFIRQGISLGAEAGMRWLRHDTEAGASGSSFTATTAEIRARWYFP